MAIKETSTANSGSRWLRWDPHFHAPGTALNDQFGAQESDFDDYLKKIEASAPIIRAVGITDYYLLDTYERVRKAKADDGRLATVDLVFPNVELRLDFGLPKGGWINAHLLVCPDDPNHLLETRNLLSQLTFRADGTLYSCNEDGLIRLGRSVDAKLDGKAAIAMGATQFKVNFQQLQDVYRDMHWASKDRNILIAIAGSKTDGTSGLQGEAEGKTRQEVERFAHAIFASSPAQRDFWLGKKSLSPDQIRQRYGDLKPCIHGSDAHEIDKVGAPDEDRLCWIKGEPTFDALRQAVIDPEGRAYVGATPPMQAPPSRVISRIEFVNAPWATTSVMDLNPGLVTIIGARGSGKTALADAIATGCDAAAEHLTEASFIFRAGPLLRDAEVRLTWGSGDTVARELLDYEYDPDFGGRYPSARYLSQKFVEKLCSADGMTDELMEEIERVIFDAQPATDGCLSFDELRDLRASRFRAARERDAAAVINLSDAIGLEREKKGQIVTLKGRIAQKEKLVKGFEDDRKKLVTSKDTETRANALALIINAIEKVNRNINHFVSKKEALLRLQDEVEGFRAFTAPENLRETKANYAAARLEDADWEDFLQRYAGDVDTALTAQIAKAQKDADGWRGQAPSALTDKTQSYLPDGADPNKQTLSRLEAERDRLQSLINIDEDARRKLVNLSQRIAAENTDLENTRTALTEAEGWNERSKEHDKNRRSAYIRVFQSVIAEESVLNELYKPLMDRLHNGKGSLEKLSFTAARKADVSAWASEGEQLFDLRRAGDFKGKGKIETWAGTNMRHAWETGDASAIEHALQHFADEWQDELVEVANVKKEDVTAYRGWLRRFAKWLYSTDHISLQYGIEYEGTDITKLSPGTRGIVLLLLYLALDDADDRPLIIDQPEENLDPKSIFDELVHLFIAAKTKRQVIMVTHNANLVVNTDADQIIVATAGAHTPGQLPPISYVSGGLDQDAMRQQVCNILEGGENAFKQRAKRLRVALER
ncbi:TrlF family AAA-like ATPase [Sphingobium sp. DN12]|uniref:TrlF family AAA-like ATPase n=1 Tax=Sphingobium sp. DN12 TaxID=3378073 RepID=UPI003DA3B425